MGSPLRESGRNSSEKLQTVAITDDFYMGTYEVTQEQYQAIMKQNPSRFKGGSLPVENVTWHQAQMFCDRLNSGNYAPAGWKFALPTSAQWEYACRAGTQTPFFWGNALNGDKANCYGSQPYGTRQKGKYVKRTTPVGSYGANAWGLYDMHGNVWEWCMDRTKDGKRVLRGGSWANGGILCRSAARFSAAPGKTNQTIGFRVVLVKKSSSDVRLESGKSRRSYTRRCRVKQDHCNCPDLRCRLHMLPSLLQKADCREKCCCEFCAESKPFAPGRSC